MIAGMPRSGTTWAKRVLECTPDLTAMMEPDSESHPASAVWAQHRAGRFPVLSPGDQDHAYHQLWSWILDGAPETFRMRMAAPILRRVRFAARKRFLEGRRVPTMSSAGALASHP